MAADLEQLARRLAELEARWPARGGPPSIPEPPSSLDELRPWLRRLHQVVTDLASDQADLQRQFSALVGIVESRQNVSSSTAGDSAAPAELLTDQGSRDGLPLRLARSMVAAVRAARGVARRAWHSSRPTDSVIRVARSDQPDRLTLAVLLPPEAASGAPSTRSGEVHEWIFWDRDGRDFQVTGPEGGLESAGQAADLGPIAAASRADVVVAGLPHPFDLPAGILELVLQVMAVEDLAFLRLRAACRDLLFVRWSWAVAATEGLALDARRLKTAAKGRVLGKSVGLGGLPGPGLPSAAMALLRPMGEHWVSKRGVRWPIRHPRALATAASAAARGQQEATAIVLTRPLGGGLDRLVAAVLEHQGRQRPTMLLQLGGEGVDPAHPVAGWRALGWRAPGWRAPGWRAPGWRAPASPPGVEASYLLPLGDLVDAPDRPHVARQLLDRHGARRVLHIGPGDGFLDRPDVLDRGWQIRHLPVAHPARPGLLINPAGDVTLIEAPLTLGTQPSELAGASLARENLGLPATAFVVTHLGDLGADERPEDLLAIFAHLRDRQDLWLLLAGRGPLGGTLDDIARYLGLERYRRLDIDPAQALAASDLVLSSAESAPVPWGLMSAARHGIPVLTCGESPVLRVFEDCGRVVPPGCFEAAAEAIGDLCEDPEVRHHLGTRGPEVFASLDDPEWLERLFADL